MKLSLITSILSSIALTFALSGCVTKYVYIEAECPHIEVMSVVPVISGPIAADGTVSPEKLGELLKGCSDLRTRTNYYETEINTYNIEYETNKKD